MITIKHNIKDLSLFKLKLQSLNIIKVFFSKNTITFKSYQDYLKFKENVDFIEHKVVSIVKKKK